MVSCTSHNRDEQDVAIEQTPNIGVSKGVLNGQIRTRSTCNEDKGKRKLLSSAFEELKTYHRPRGFNMARHDMKYVWYKGCSQFNDTPPKF